MGGGGGGGEWMEFTIKVQTIPMLVVYVTVWYIRVSMTCFITHAVCNNWRVFTGVLNA